MLPVVVRYDGTAVPVIPPGAQPPFDVVILSQNQYLRDLIDNPPPAPFDLYLQSQNQLNDAIANRLSAMLTSPGVTGPTSGPDAQTPAMQGAAAYKIAQAIVTFDQNNQILANLGLSADQIIRGLALDILG